MRSLGWSLFQCDWYPYKKKGNLDSETDTHTHTHTHTHTQGECRVKIKAEIQHKPRNIKDGQQATVAGERHGTDSPSQPLEGTLLPASRIVRQYISVV